MSHRDRHAASGALKSSHSLASARCKERVKQQRSKTVRNLDGQCSKILCHGWDDVGKYLSRRIYLLDTLQYKLLWGLHRLLPKAQQEYPKLVSLSEQQTLLGQHLYHHSIGLCHRLLPSVHNKHVSLQQTTTSDAQMTISLRHDQVCETLQQSFLSVAGDSRDYARFKPDCSIVLAVQISQALPYNVLVDRKFSNARNQLSDACSVMHATSHQRLHFPFQDDWIVLWTHHALSRTTTCLESSVKAFHHCKHIDGTGCNVWFHMCTYTTPVSLSLDSLCLCVLSFESSLFLSCGMWYSAEDQYSNMAVIEWQVPDLHQASRIQYRLEITLESSENRRLSLPIAD